MRLKALPEKKCELGLNSVKWFGHIYSERGMEQGCPYRFWHGGGPKGGDKGSMGGGLARDSRQIYQSTIRGVQRSNNKLYLG